MRHVGRLILCGFLLSSIAGCDGLFETDNTRLQKGLDAVAAGNYGEAYWAWRPLADRDYADAQYQLAWLYANGNGLRVNLGEAVEWWRRAAGNGHVESEFAIGMAYLNGQGKEFESDMAAALRWLIRAARHGSGDAKELALELLVTNTDKVLAARRSLLEEPWLGTPLKAVEAEAGCFAERSRKAKRLADIPPDTVVRKTDERNGWVRIVAPSLKALCWAPAKQFADTPGSPAH